MSHSAVLVTPVSTADATKMDHTSSDTLGSATSQTPAEQKKTGKRDSCGDGDVASSGSYDNKENKERLVQTSGRSIALHRVNVAGKTVASQHSDMQRFYFETQKKLACRSELINKLQLDVAELHYDCVTTATPDVEDKFFPCGDDDSAEEERG